MAVEITILSQLFSNPYNNGTDLFSNLTKTNNLTGFASERQRAVITLSVESSALGTPSAPFFVENIGGTTWKFTRGSGSWRDDGMSVGDAIQVDEIATIPPFPQTANGNITSVDDTVLIFNLTGGSLVDIGETFAQVADVLLRNQEPITALKYGFGLNSNDEEYNNINKVTGSAQSYSLNGITGVLTVMVPDGIDVNADWITLGRCAVKKTATSPDLFTQTFQLDHTFRITPFYVEGQLSNYENKILTPLYAGDASIKYTSNFDFRTVLSNPNTSTIISTVVFSAFKIPSEALPVAVDL